jgi:hypothetical protein
VVRYPGRSKIRRRVRRGTAPPGFTLGGANASRKDLAKLQRLDERTQRFAADRRPNIYQRAQVLNKLKWRLNEAGYPDAFIASVVNAVIGRLR